MLEQKASRQDVDDVQSFGCGTRSFQGLDGAVVNKAVAVVVVIDLHDGEEAVKEFHLAAGECMD